MSLPSIQETPEKSAASQMMSDAARIATRMPDAPKKQKLTPFAKDVIALDEAFCLFNSNPPWEILTFLELKSVLKGPVTKLQTVLMKIGDSKDPIAAAYGDCHGDGGVSEFFMYLGDAAFKYAPVADDDEIKDALTEAAHLAIGIAMLVDVHEGKYDVKEKSVEVPADDVRVSPGIDKGIAVE
jgi:hypothetical protein